MALDFRVKCFLLFCLGFFASATVAENEEENVFVQEFDVKPGGHVQTAEHSYGDFVCKFTYACQGGTKESWAFTISHSDDNTEFSCEVDRPDGNSYLFFEQFKIEIQGAQIEAADAWGDSDNVLSPDQIIVDTQKNEVRHNPGKFKSQLSGLAVHAAIQGHEEL